MRERLIEYIDGLFSGAALNMRNAEIKEEILQNTLEHYDDLLSEGKSEQEAYDTVIQGIGDVRPLVEPEGSAVSAEAARIAAVRAGDRCRRDASGPARSRRRHLDAVHGALPFDQLHDPRMAYHMDPVSGRSGGHQHSERRSRREEPSRLRTQRSHRGALASDHGAVLRAQLCHRRVAPDVDPVPDRRSGDGAGFRDL